MVPFTWVTKLSCRAGRPPRAACSPPAVRCAGRPPPPAWAPWDPLDSWVPLAPWTHGPNGSHGPHGSYGSHASPWAFMGPHGHMKAYGLMFYLHIYKYIYIYMYAFVCASHIHSWLGRASLALSEFLKSLRRSGRRRSCGIAGGCRRQQNMLALWHMP